MLIAEVRILFSSISVAKSLRIICCGAIAAMATERATTGWMMSCNALVRAVRTISWRRVELTTISLTWGSWRCGPMSGFGGGGAACGVWLLFLSLLGSWLF